jgi:hypothetical protein
VRDSPQPDATHTRIAGSIGDSGENHRRRSQIDGIFTTAGRARLSQYAPECFGELPGIRGIPKRVLPENELSSVRYALLSRLLNLFEEREGVGSGGHLAGYFECDGCCEAVEDNAISLCSGDSRPLDNWWITRNKVAETASRNPLLRRFMSRRSGSDVRIRKR